MKQIDVRVEDDDYAGIEARAAAAGLSVADYAKQVLASEANAQRAQFLAVGDHILKEWGPHFAERFGYPTSRSEASGRAA